MDLPLLQEWALALGVLVGTAMIVAGIRTLLRGIQSNGHWMVIRQLAPPVSNLIYVIGLNIFSEIAPLKPKPKLWLEHAVYVLTVMIVLNLLRRAALIGINWTSLRGLQSRTLEQGFIPLLRNVVTLFVFFTGSIMILKHFDYDVMSLLTALGVGSLAVGLAAKETLSNMISGFTLIIDKNLSPGDRINLGGTVGDVEEIGLRSTRIRVTDGNMLIVPNSELVNTKILNLSLPSKEATGGAVIRVPYSVSFSRVKAIALEALEQTKGAKKDKGKSVTLSSLTDGYQTITVGFWFENQETSGDTISELNERLLARLKQEGIELVPVAGIPARPSAQNAQP